MSERAKQEDRERERERETYFILQPAKGLAQNTSLFLFVTP